jgi:predicted TIM-barrel fold metal-dependent hydrolase
MLIDIHVHAAREKPLVQARHRPLGADLVAMMDAAGIDMAVVLSAVSPECRTYYNTPEDILAVCRQFPDRLIPFCSLDPRWVGNSAESDFGPLLQAFKQAGCRGVGEYMANLPFDDPMNLNVFRHVEAAGLPLIFHIAPAPRNYYGCLDELGLPRLEKALRAFPRLRFVGHSQPFWSHIGADVNTDNWRGYPEGPVKPGRLVQMFRDYPNLYGDLSARSGCNAITRDLDFGCTFLEEFQDRLLFGTDICYVGQELPIVEHFRRLRQEGMVSREALEKVSWRNARDLLGLAIPDA